MEGFGGIKDEALPWPCTDVHRLRAFHQPRIQRESKRGAKRAAGAITPMESTAAAQAREKSARAAAPTMPERRTPLGSVSEVPSEKKPVGYGLPCARCHAYYPADMHACPICKSPERVSPNQPGTPSAAVPPVAVAPSTGASIDEERERRLKELKSQAFASHKQINTAPGITAPEINAPAAFQCVLKHQHSGVAEPAAVCHSCYSNVRQKADLMEAALHMDPKDGAKIVYEAVWADTSDPTVTYLNAAKAILSELQQRAGIRPLLGKNQPLAH